MATVRFSELASTNLYEHVEYIAKDKPSAAYRWLESIESTCALLANNPELGELRQSRGHGTCRTFMIGNFFAERELESKSFVSCAAVAIWIKFECRGKTTVTSSHSTDTPLTYAM